MIKKSTTTFLFLFLMAVSTAVFAVPTLQMYSPDATYYAVNPWFPDSEDTWIITENPFDFQVLGATQPDYVYYIRNVELHISLLEDDYNAAVGLSTPFISIIDTDPNITVNTSVYADDFTYGTPDGVSPHGIYPTYFTSVILPDLLVGSAGETVNDYNPGATGSDIGDIQYYRISYDPRFRYVHFDLTGVAYDFDGNKSKAVFAPYSHDADDVPGTPPVPEPMTMIMLGSGLLGMAGLGFRKRA